MFISDGEKPVLEMPNSRGCNSQKINNSTREIFGDPEILETSPTERTDSSTPSPVLFDNQEFNDINAIPATPVESVLNHNIEDENDPPLPNLSPTHNSSVKNRTHLRNHIHTNSVYNSVYSHNSSESPLDLNEPMSDINAILENSSRFAPGEMVNPAARMETMLPHICHPLAPIFLAFFVCLLFTLNIGSVISDSLTVPFTVWMAHKLWCISSLPSNKSGSLLGTALILSGVAQTTVAKYNQIMSAIQCVVEDLSMYMVFIVLWQVVFGQEGLTEEAQEEPEATAAALD
ncbi:uncharacterized protein LOC143019643 isoform X2 [Oratosquilla oratoria]|uniref:uncharacterized protein LOC143019643 isoform X2 n=1 Tax=Oratosquilla oratoria TaxID=337810 RepID=UPI003F759848